MQAYPVEVRITLSKKLPPGVSEVRFGPYLLHAIPSEVTEGGEAVLLFNTGDSQPESIGSDPEAEAAIVCRLLSLLLDTRYRRAGFRLNYIDIPYINEQREYPQFLGIIDTSNLDEHIKRIQSLDEGIARQFLRASHTYSFALDFIPSDAAFAFFLLSVSVECLSSQDSVIPFEELQPEGKTAERFVRFVQTYLPDHARSLDERNQELFTELLKTVYYTHRSGFVHGGKEVSVASPMADRVASSYFKHKVKGKEQKTPGIGWFARIVRGALIGFLHSETLETHTEDAHLFARIALEKAVLHLEAKRPIEKHTVVTRDDIEYR
jgi:hypothetical protein